VGRVFGYDPTVPKDDLARVPGVEFCSIEEGFRGADCVVIMNDHRSYLRWDIYELLVSMNRPALFLDGWRLFQPSDICKVEGITYGALGIDYVGDTHTGRLLVAPRQVPES
jgi:UDP-N-acetyl-D-mannosaminuronate dehydrogenase